MVSTRSRTSSPIKKSTAAISDVSAAQQTDQEPFRLLIATHSISTDSRLLLLHHPRDSQLTRFLTCPSTGLYELTRISAPSTDPRSVLFAPTLDSSETAVKDEDAGYINKSADYLTATPFDLVFLVLAIVAQDVTSTRKALFQPLDDIFETVQREDKHFRYVLDKCQVAVQRAMMSICDTVEAGDEQMFRYNEDKAVEVIWEKAKRAIVNGLPASLEEHFVTRVLETPVLSIKREETNVTIKSVGDPETPSDSPSDIFDSQHTDVSSAASAVFSETSIASTTITAVEDSVPLEVKCLQRLRTAFQYITSSYLPTHLFKRFEHKLATSKSLVNFEPLDNHLKQIASSRAEALNSRSLTDFSRKRGSADDEELAEMRAEKKRKLEEDEKKKKANESRGVRDLKKVNVTGMKKMSDFFIKKSVTTKVKS